MGSRGKPRQGTFFEPSTVGAAPPPRADHCCVALGGHIVVHGGNSAHGPLEDMYALNVGAAARSGAWRWERVSPQGEVPPARFGHSLVRVSDTTAVLFGGADDNEYRWYNDTYTLRFSFEGTPASPGATRCISIAAGGAAPTSTALPTPRCGHSLSLVPTSPPSLVLFGGSNTRGALNDLWTLDPETLSWQPAGAVDGAPPPPRAFHASAMVGRTLVVVGGRNGYEYLRDAYTLNTGLGGGRWARIAWSAIGEPFPALAYHHLVALPGGRLLVFGGFGADGTTALHAAIDIDYSRATWRRGEDMPRARSNHSVVLMGGVAAGEGSERGLTVLIFGGFDGHDFCSHLVGLSLSLPAGVEAEVAEAVPESTRGRRESFSTGVGGAGGATVYDRLATGSAVRPPPGRPRSAPVSRTAVTTPSPSLKASALAAARAYSSGVSTNVSRLSHSGGSAYTNASGQRSRAQSAPSSRGGAGGFAFRARDSLDFGSGPLLGASEREAEYTYAPTGGAGTLRRPPSPSLGLSARSPSRGSQYGLGSRAQSPGGAQAGLAATVGGMYGSGYGSAAATPRPPDEPTTLAGRFSTPRHRSITPGRSILSRRGAARALSARTATGNRPLSPGPRTPGRLGATTGHINAPRLRFAMVHVREFERGVDGDGVPGDGGVPLNLSDGVARDLSVRLVDWELARRGRRIPSKRFVEEGRLDADARAAMLSRAGVSHEQQQAACREAERMQVERHESNVLDTYALHPDDLNDEYETDNGGGYGGGQSYDANYTKGPGPEDLDQTWYPRSQPQAPARRI